MRNVGTARYQFTLVNGRFVRDRLLQHALRQAYEETHPKGRYPILCLCMEIPPDRIDVNVHPRSSVSPAKDLLPRGMLASIRSRPEIQRLFASSDNLGVTPRN